MARIVPADFFVAGFAVFFVAALLVASEAAFLVAGFVAGVARACFAAGFASASFFDLVRVLLVAMRCHDLSDERSHYRVTTE
ncbi:MAG: hypothetical protein QM831_34990 [Kofleriaceae bacterium]